MAEENIGKRMKIKSYIELVSTYLTYRFHELRSVSKESGHGLGAGTLFLARMGAPFLRNLVQTGPETHRGAFSYAVGTGDYLDEGKT
jgi:hypothetical protein